MSITPRLARTLRLAAASVLLAVIALWITTGAHTGWTRTAVTVLQHDAITGIEYPVHQKTLVVGVELLAAGVGFAAVLGAASLVVRRRSAVAHA